MEYSDEFLALNFCHSIISANVDNRCYKNDWSSDQVIETESPVICTTFIDPAQKPNDFKDFEHIYANECLQLCFKKTDQIIFYGA
jgi:hypothetical protein